MSVTSGKDRSVEVVPTLFDPEKPQRASAKQKPDWNSDTITYSETNPEVHPYFRNYFDRHRERADTTGRYFSNHKWIPTWSLRMYKMGFKLEEIHRPNRSMITRSLRFGMLQRRCIVLLKETAASIPSTTPVNQSSFGKIIAKGVVYGGLSGGLLGLGVEMSPEEWGFKQKLRELGDKLKKYIGENKTSSLGNVPQRNSAPSVSSIPVEPSVIPSDSPVEQDVIAVSVPSTESVDEAHSVTNGVVPTEDQHSTVTTPAHSISLGKIESVIESVPEQKESTSAEEIASGHASQSPEHASQSSENVSESPDDVSHSSERAIPDDHSALESYQAEIQSLQRTISEMEALRKEDLARQSGVHQASIETMERLYAEREFALSLARRSLTIVSLLQELARDNSPHAPGVLKLEFESKLGSMVQSCFAPSNQANQQSMFRLMISSILARLYSPQAGDVLPELRTNNYFSSSPTWERLAALQVARRALARGDFFTAVSHLELISQESPDAAEWVQKSRIAMELWHSATAAVAHMYDEVSQIGE